ncbi:EEF1A lysine methyltransferase 4 isoform X2 [Mangifera indica]|uniref:EEF1A lysine methyltransferase 4 isoform X2 n=1 Tax=Mangifera indica TaxID=29780 RepID=UPI001CFBF44D|nr:EEF1A lysine methyltransferase 4 isoform X2 [Mangifera indica]
MTIGSTTQAYGESWYWDNRYSHESGPFDWYQKYPALAPLINLYIPQRHQRILVVGCGNSAFGEGMVEDGYEDVVNIDISAVVIEAMQRKYSGHCPQLKCSFGAVIDKGTLDSILCGSNSQQNASQMLTEVWRVLKDKGVYILVTYGAPIYRLNLLRNSSLWRIKLHVIEKLMVEEKSEHPIWELTNPVPMENEGSSVEAVLGNNPDVHYIYVCTKDESLKAEAEMEIAAH